MKKGLSIHSTLCTGILITVCTLLWLTPSSVEAVSYLSTAGGRYHTAALNNHLTIQIALGGTSIILRKFEPQSLLKTIEKEKATIVR